MRPFRLVATVLLPDHWHLVMSLPAGDFDYPTRLKQIKEGFTKEWLFRDLPEAEVTESQRLRGERGIWQPRYWEHTITDEDDLEGCVTISIGILGNISWSIVFETGPGRHSSIRYRGTVRYQLGWRGTQFLGYKTRLGRMNP